MRTIVRAGLLAVALVSLSLLSSACGDGTKTTTGRGFVRDVRPAWSQVVIEHGELPGLMPAMTMNFDVADPKLLDALFPGQSVEFDVAFDGKAYTVTRIERLSEAEIAADGAGGSLAKLLPEAELAPDFALIDQEGRPRRLSEFRGRVVLLDFIYTRCTGPCPLVTGLHVDVQRALPPEARARVQFVSVSLDPVNDTPPVLDRYAKARGVDLESWCFLTGPTDAVSAMLSQYGVGTTRADDGEIEHNVVAFLIDPKGRIARRYLGLRHDPAAMARELAALARTPA